MHRPSKRELFYDDMAGDFDAVMNQEDLQRRLRLFFDELLPSSLAGQQLLDGGCGTGWFSVEAARRGAYVTSIDVGPALLRVAREKGATRCVATSVLALALADDTFDIVLSTEVIEHTVAPYAALSEYFRVLRPGGLLVLSCPNWTWKWSAHVAHWLKLRPYEGLENWPSYWGLARAMRRVGFRVERQLGFHLVPPQVTPLHRVRRWADRHGDALGILMLNQAVVATKPSVSGA